MRGRRSALGLMLLVARREYLRSVRRRGFLFATLILPLGLGFVVGLTGLIGGGVTALRDPEEVSVALVNESPLVLEESAAAAARIRLVTRREGEAALAGGEIGELYVLAADYLASGRVERVTGGTRGLDIAALERRQRQLGVLAEHLRSTLLAGEGVPTQVAERVLDPVELAERQPDGSAAGDRFDFGAFFLPYALSLLFVISIFITSGYLLQSVTEEKENRVVEIVLSSVPALPLMGGKILGLGGAGLTQVLVWLVIAVNALPVISSRVAAGGSSELGLGVLALGMVYFVLGYLGYGAIFSAIGALAPGTREAQQYAGFLGFFAVIPLMFSGLFLADPSSPVIAALALFPLTAPATVLQLVAFAPDPPWAVIAASLVALAAFSALATLLSARIFRATLLLYGARPGVRQIWRAMVAPS